MTKLDDSQCYASLVKSIQQLAEALDQDSRDKKYVSEHANGYADAALRVRSLLSVRRA